MWNVSQCDWFFLTHILKEHLDISVPLLESCMIKAARRNGFQKLHPSGDQMQLLILFSVVCLPRQRPRVLYADKELTVQGSTGNTTLQKREGLPKKLHF